MRLIDADALKTKKVRSKERHEWVVPVAEIDWMPTIEERKKGKWIEDGYNYIKAVCSICGEPCATYIMGNPRDRFCKWCGADMRGEGENR